MKLSPREKQIAALVVNGYKNKEIAEELGLTIKSVGARISRIYVKAGIWRIPNARECFKMKFIAVTSE